MADIRCERTLGPSKKHSITIKSLNIAQDKSKRAMVRTWKCITFILHVVTAGMIRPMDLGIGSVSYHWTTPIVIDEYYGHSAHEPVWAWRWYHVPELRYQWGDRQHELHAGAKELFLDLIFVGIAYEVGVSLKASMYTCDPNGGSGSGSDGSISGSEGSGSGSSDGSGSGGSRSSGSNSGGSGSGNGSWSGSGSGSGIGRQLSVHSGRQLAGAGAPLPLCNGVMLGLLHGLAPFMAAYLMWGIETRYNARFARSSKIHQVSRSPRTRECALPYDAISGPARPPGNGDLTPQVPPYSTIGPR